MPRRLLFPALPLAALLLAGCHRTPAAADPQPFFDACGRAIKASDPREALRHAEAALQLAATPEQRSLANTCVAEALLALHRFREAALTFDLALADDTTNSTARQGKVRVIEQWQFHDRVPR